MDVNQTVKWPLSTAGGGRIFRQIPRLLQQWQRPEIPHCTYITRTVVQTFQECALERFSSVCHLLSCNNPSHERPNFTEDFFSSVPVPPQQRDLRVAHEDHGQRQGQQRPQRPQRPQWPQRPQRRRRQPQR